MKSTKIWTMLLVLLVGCGPAFAESDTDGLAVDKRLTYARAFEAVVWATPFLNTLQMRNELDRLGIKDGQLAFVGSPPSPNLVLPTFNNQTGRHLLR